MHLFLFFLHQQERRQAFGNLPKIQNNDSGLLPYHTIMIQQRFIFRAMNVFGVGPKKNTEKKKNEYDSFPNDQ